MLHFICNTINGRLVCYEKELEEAEVNDTSGTIFTESNEKGEHVIISKC
jgi:hypothetical protein